MVITLVPNSTPYRLNALDKNPINDNQYIYLSGIDGDISVMTTSWKFSLDIYLNDNFVLPINTIYANLNCSFATVSNLSITPKTTVSYPSYVLDTNSCDHYICSFIIDTSDSTFFDQRLSNYLLNIEISFSINYDMLNQAQLTNPATEIDQFASELESINFNTLINFSNYSEINEKNELEIINEYHFSNDISTITKTSSLQYTPNENTIDKKTPINNLFALKTNGNFILNGYQIDIVYSIEDKEMKTLSYSSDNPIICANEYIFNYPFSTAIDENDNLYNYIGDTPGIYFDKKAVGYYQITTVVLINQTYYTLKLIQPFNFLDSTSYGKQITINKIIINSLNNFKEIFF